MPSEITLTAGAAKKKISYNAMLRLVLIGQVEGRQDERGRWMVSEASLDAWTPQHAHAAAA